MLRNLYRSLFLFQGLCVVLLAGVMAITQAKIGSSLAARAFLAHAPALPLPAPVLCTAAFLSFSLLLAGCFLYGKTRGRKQYAALALEIFSCLALMRSLSFAYDGMVLLVVANILAHYRGKRQELLLLAAMAGLYFLAGYNLAYFEGSVVPFEQYAAYYAPAARSALLALRGFCASGSLILFVLYAVLLVESTHEEGARVRVLNEKLADANEQLRAYALASERLAETRERNRLAREIHDTLGHALTGIVAGLDACLVLMDDAPDIAKAQLVKIRETARRGMTDVRRSVKKLRPDDLEKHTLADALEKLTRDFAASSGMEIQLELLALPTSLREDEEEVIYRVVQESVTNANQHGKASRAHVTLGANEKNLYIAVRDNGTGAEDLTPGFGLRHMQERVDLLHGTLSYWSDHGFVIKVTLPLGKGETNA